MKRLRQFLPILGRPKGPRLLLAPDNLRTESAQCAIARRSYFQWLRQNPALYHDFLNRSVRK